VTSHRHRLVFTATNRTLKPRPVKTRRIFRCLQSFFAQQFCSERGFPLPPPASAGVYWPKWSAQMVTHFVVIGSKCKRLGAEPSIFPTPEYLQHPIYPLIFSQSPGAFPHKRYICFTHSRIKASYTTVLQNTDKTFNKTICQCVHQCLPQSFRPNSQNSTQSPCQNP
jgi:hypothetical protein